MHDVVGHPARGLERVRVLGPARVEEGRPGPGVADPVGVGIGRDRETEMGQVEHGGLRGSVGAVLVAGHHDAAHLVVHRVLADVVGHVVGPVEALDHHLGHAVAHAEPDRHAHDQDVGGEDLLEDLRPLVAVAEIGFHPEGNVVVDRANQLGLDVEVVQVPDHDVHQALGVRALRRLLQRAVEQDGVQRRHGR